MKIISRKNIDYPKTIPSKLKHYKDFNLLRIKLIRNLFSRKSFPYSLQLFMLLVFIFLLIAGWQIYTPENMNDKLFAKSNLVTLVIWGIWWPLMVWLAVIIGRVWCMICPLEFVSSITERIGKRFGLKQKFISKWIRGGALIVVIYAVIQLLVAGIHLHRIPAYTSFFLLGLLMLSAFVGFFFKDRAFCRGFCPIGMLLNAYGRGGMIAVRSGSVINFQSGAEKNDLIACGNNKYDRIRCPSLLNPQKLNSNKDCLICGQCIKSCKTDNMQLLLRKPFDNKDDIEEKASWPLTIFIMLLSGFVTYELTSEWKPMHELFFFLPDYLAYLFNLNNFEGFVNGIWTIIVFPFLLWFILGFLNMANKGVNSITESWRKSALPFAVIISAGHLTKSLIKLNSWISFLPVSINNFSDETNEQLISSGINIPGLIYSNFSISIIGILLLSVALIYSVKMEKYFCSKISISMFIPKFLIYLIYIITVIGFGFFN